MTSGIEFLDKLVQNYEENVGSEDLTFLQGEIAMRGNDAADGHKLDRIKTCSMRPYGTERPAAGGKPVQGPARQEL